MRATIPYIQQKFKEFNQQMFAGELPEIPVRLSDVKTYFGKCSFKKMIFGNGETVYFDFLISINSRPDLPEPQLEDIIIHEMIHCFIAYKKLEDASVHGPVFRHIMENINEKYGRNLTISRVLTEEERKQLIDKKQHWHVVAVVTYRNGKTGVKVLPRVLPSILKFYNVVGMNNRIAHVQLYMSNDVFFNQYPNSASFRVYYADVSEVNEHLHDAETLECDGKSVRKTSDTATK